MYKDISISQLKEFIDNDPDAVVIDVRTPGEVSTGTIPGAVIINLFDPMFMENIKKLDKSKTYLFLCQSGNRSGSAAGCLVQLGFEKVYNIMGGIMAWDGETEYPKAA